MESSLENGSATETPPSSEFAIKYTRNKENLPHLSPISKFLPVAAGKRDTKPDVMAYVIHCPKHDSMALYLDPSGCKWLPFTTVIPNVPWTESATSGVLAVLFEDKETYHNYQSEPPILRIVLLEIQRVQLPQTLNFLSRIIYYVELDSSNPNFLCCSNKIDNIKWVTHGEIAKGIENLWGPELMQYSRLIQSDFEDFSEKIEEISLDDVYLYSPRDPPRNAEELMLLELNISEKTIQILYNDFLDHCWPCISMPLDSFKYYLSKYGFRLDDPRLNKLFIAFNYSKNRYVSFHELLMGLVSLEPQALHRDVRFKFLYRYYDQGNKGYIDLKDFAKLVADLLPNLHGDALEGKVNEYADIVCTTKEEDNRCLTFSTFHDAIASQRLRGTSKLCRSRFPVFLQLMRAFIRRRKPTSDGCKEWQDLSSVLLPRTHKGTCKTCRARRYKLATHVVNLDENGYVCKPTQVKTGDSKPPHDRHSIEIVFNAKSTSNTLISLIREFAKNKGTVEEPKGLLAEPKERKRLLEIVTRLVKDVKALVKGESRLLNVSSPCYVIGDIHGNIEDLLSMERALWMQVPCLGANYLFLGDYVDRGKWGLECTLYLFALKLLDSSKILLLRGNHEIRALQERYSYKNECLNKYGLDIGERIWNLTNEVFDMLPVAAIIDDKIFCVHGGISPTGRTLEQIRSIPVPLANPEQNSKIAWELLWSDPCHMQQFLDIIDLTDVPTVAEFAQDGYVYNSKRNAAFLFNERAAIAFLERNDLSHILRGHEVPTFGFTHHFTNLCTTVFSCSHYCGNDNEAGFIFVDSNKIRAIRLDTHNNKSATD